VTDSSAAQAIAGLITAAFIVGMVWLRTRMHYAGRGRGVLQLQPAGRLYFAAVVLVLAAGWWLAPRLALLSGSQALANATLLRAIWFLATYYVFILVHRLLQSRNVAVFAPRGRATPDQRI
jgi:hypothetical protein